VKSIYAVLKVSNISIVTPRQPTISPSEEVRWREKWIYLTNLPVKEKTEELRWRS
jgi:hypothetical protein